MQVRSRSYGLIAAWFLVPALCFAQSYPTKPIRMIVPYAPGGSIDILARQIADKLSGTLGQQVIVDNRGGAGGALGSELAAQATPDGYTILMGNVGPLAIQPALVRKPRYQPLKDFAAVSLISALPFLLVASNRLPVHNLKELVALAKAKPGTINFASSGTGSGLHLAGVMLKNAAKIDIVHVPYKGFSQAFPDLMSGSVQLMFNTIPSLLPHVKAGRLTPLVLTAKNRSPLLPEVPTTVEAGYPRLIAGSWHAIVVPHGTPKSVIDKLNRAVVTVTRAPEVEKTLESQGAQPIGSSPEELTAFMKSEIAKWGEVVRSSGVAVN